MLSPQEYEFALQRIATIRKRFPAGCLKMRPHPDVATLILATDRPLTRWQDGWRVLGFAEAEQFARRCRNKERATRQKGKQR